MHRKKIFILAFLVSMLFMLSKATAASEFTVVINEMAWMGTKASSNDEWIELYNNAAYDIDLEGWSLVNSDKSLNVSLKGIVPANGYFLLERTDDTTVSDIIADMVYTGGLDNGGEKLELKNASGDIKDAVDCASGWFAGDNAAKASMERIDSGLFSEKNNWAASTGQTGKDAKGSVILGTPKAANSAQKEEKSDESSVSAPDADDPAGYDNPSEDSVADSTDKKNNAVKGSGFNDVIISEIFPAPWFNGREKEFIELYNKGEGEINLAGWRIENSKGEKYEIPASSSPPIIKSKSYFLIFRKESKIAMDNKKDAIKIFTPAKTKPSQTVKYSNSKENYSYSLVINGDRPKGRIPKAEWTWSSMPTPGADNYPRTVNHAPEIEVYFPDEIIAGEAVIFDASDTIDDDGDDLKFSWDFGDGGRSEFEMPEHTFFSPGTAKIKIAASDGYNEVKKEISVKIKEGASGIVAVAGKSSSASAKKEALKKKTAAIKAAGKSTVKKKTAKIAVKEAAAPIAAALEKIGQLKVGDYVKVSGQVAVLPGIFGVQYFYIVGLPAGEAGSHGIQVYNYKKDFPNLKIGDFIEVTGELSESGGERRLKTKAGADIKILKHGKEPIAEELSSDELSGDYAGRLVKIAGEITGKKGQNIYIDDGIGEMDVYIKKGTEIGTALFKAGKRVSVTGLVGIYKANAQVMPRSPDDVRYEDAELEIPSLEPIATTSDGLKVAERDKKSEALYYLLIIAAGIIVAGGVWGVRKLRNH